jgi:hypothetical protein
MEMNLRSVIDYERDGWKESMPLQTKNVVSISDRSEARFTSNGVGFTANIDPDPFYWYQIKQFYPFLLQILCRSHLQDKIFL